MPRPKLKKVLFGFIGIVAVLFVVVLLLVIFQLGAVVKTAVETAGPKITGVPVTLDTARIYPLRGKAMLKGFVVGNPKGYDAPESIRLGELKVDMDVGSITKDKIIIHSIVIDGPEITLEGNPFGDNNLTQLQKNIEGPAAAKEPAPAPETKPKPEATPKPAKPAKTVLIEDLLITNIKLNFGTAMSLPLPDIHMQDIGKDKDVTFADSINLIFKAILNSVKEVGAGLFKLGGKGVKLVGETAGDVVGGVGNVAGDTVGAAATGIKKLGSGLGHLIPGGDAAPSDNQQSE